MSTHLFVERQSHVPVPADRQAMPAAAVPDYRIVILGAAPTVHGDVPPAMVPIGNEGRTLDWLLAAFGRLPGAQVEFVSGFMAHEVMKHYDNIRFHLNPHWRSTGPARSLAVAPLDSRIATFVCYSDVVFRSDIVRRMADRAADLALATDRQWRVRYDGRSGAELASAEKVVLEGVEVKRIGKLIPVEDADAEFAGLLKMSGRIARRLQGVLASSIFADGDGIPEVVTFLINRNIRAQGVDVGGQWAELNAPQDLARFVLGTKAESLERLKPLLTSAVIGDMVRFSQTQWRHDRAAVLAGIRAAFGATRVIVRSSAISEDSWLASAAGAHKSIPDLFTAEENVLAAAIEDVFSSYRGENAENQVLIQEMLTGVRMSGVVMTRTHAHNAPYYVLNFDDTTSRTDTVTSGDGRDLKTLFVHRDQRLDHRDGDFGRVMRAVYELEHLVGHNSLDIEFAVTDNGIVHVLQVRPIATGNVATVNDAAVAKGIHEAQNFFSALQHPAPFVLGASTSLSVMTDWNPAEIVGTKPSRLALSLYRYLITDEIWARQRAEYGYRDVRPTNLIVDILGHPFVDVRVDFNTFIPAPVDDGLARRLVEHHVDHLMRCPELHDKVEFEIVFTCWSFDFEGRSRRLLEAGFTPEEVGTLGEALRVLTRNGIRRIRADSEALESCRDRFERIAASSLPPLERAYLHLENAKTGALYFAHLARAGFVAMTLLRSLLDRGVISATEKEAFLASLKTISTTIQLDALKVARGELAWEAFVAEYGHLRPGTYDINSPRYDRAPEQFLRPIVEEVRSRGVRLSEFGWSSGARARIEAELAVSGLQTDFDGLDSFMRLAITGREYGKFIFTRDLSAALEALAEYGEEHFVPREELGHISIEELVSLRSAAFESPSVVMHEFARKGRAAYQLQQSVCMPDQIFQPGDLLRFDYRKTVPNYVTRKTVRAPLVCLDSSSSPDVDLSGQIALIPSADPGFDWIFSRGIVGLITMYGGVNSHMSIRMAEFELPGVTGIGELLFNQLRQARAVELDCGARRIRVIDEALP